jgi:hypothetical protein
LLIELFRFHNSLIALFFGRLSFTIQRRSSSMAFKNSKEGSSSPCDTPPLSSAGMSEELQPKKEGEATFTANK